MRIGIFFGGNSREREVSFAGGRTVYDNLDKMLFEPVPIFVDSFNNFILLDWKYIYKGSIRDFYPPVDALAALKLPVQVYAESLAKAHSDNGLSLAQSLGKVIPPQELSKYIDFAFLALHGSYGEDGTIQGLLEWYKIPYSGSGILPSATGMQKKVQKRMMQHARFKSPRWTSVSKKQWQAVSHKNIFNEVLKHVKPPFVVKPANQGSSVGVSVVSKSDFSIFEKAINHAFFYQRIDASEWKKKTREEKISFLQKIADVKEGIAFPVMADDVWLYSPDEAYEFIENALKKKKEVVLESQMGETDCLIEEFIEGREFSCIVLQNKDGLPVALPPTEIVKGSEVYDYRSKYLPGLSRKITPMNIPASQIKKIRKECERLFDFFHFNTYARIDGFIKKDGTIFLNDPNTTSGMMPSSFFFHQAAEIGLTPSQFLTYIIRTSLAQRVATWSQHINLVRQLSSLDEKLNKMKERDAKKISVAVFMGGYSSERHISVESGRNIFEKLASSVKYHPFPVFVTGNDNSHTLYQIPINMMLKDNADDIKEKIQHYRQSAVLDEIRKECSDIIEQYGDARKMFKPEQLTYQQLKKKCDAVFIALHGRPGEDGTVQAELDKLGIYYNGSGVKSSRITINKYDTNEILHQHGVLVADHFLVHQDEWKREQKKVLQRIKQTGFPLIAKPADDGCSSAVKKIRTEQQLIDYAEGIFRQQERMTTALEKKLQLKHREEFPRKKLFLIEKFIDKNNADHFLEITGGMITHYYNGKLEYETFEASEALAEGEILSLEEKFLAGQGQNITPARYHADAKKRQEISLIVQKELAKVARILDVQGYCRIDAFVRIFKNKKPEIIIIEINSLPGMTPATAIFHQCALNNYKPYEFIDAILKFGKQRMLRNSK